MLLDTKNRSDHKLLLSRQALEIAARNSAGKKADAPLFSIIDARKTLAWINSRTGTSVQGHGLRATFASIAEELVSGAVLKKMMNHAAGGDVTLGHYVGKSEAQLRAGWQTVADFIEAAAEPSEARPARQRSLASGKHGNPWQRRERRAPAPRIGAASLVGRDGQTRIQDGKGEDRDNPLAPVGR